MEINLVKYTNMINKQEKTFIIRRDEMKYKDIDKDKDNDYNHEKKIHVDSLELVNKKIEDNNIEMKVLDKIIFLSSKNEVDALKFRTYLNLLKFVYTNNIIHYDFEIEERFKFRAKEYIVNIKQYVKNFIFEEILSNILKRKDEFRFIIEILQSKLDTLGNDSALNIFPYIKNLILEINSEFNIECIDKYNDRMNHLIHYNNTEENDEFQTYDFVINNIDKVNEIYLNLCRILLELRKGIMDIIVNIRFKELSMENYKIDNIINKQLFKFIRTEEKSNTLHFNIKQQLLKKKILLEKEKLITNTNKKEKDILRHYISNRSFQILFCFKCGNLLKRLEKVQSNCNLDTNCKEYSNYFCFCCKINYCTQCIIEIKHGKCAKGHLIFKYEGEFNKNCFLCEIEINQEGYSCNLCDISTCIICYNKYGTFCPIKCITCKSELQWLRSQYEKCRKCQNISDCFWRCFFCDFYYCIKCFPSPVGFCGQLHYLENNNDQKNKINSINFKNYISITSTKTCSKCLTTLPNQYECCRRCNYTLCYICTEINI